MKLNENFQSLGESYLFVTIAKKVAAYQREHPEAKIIKMGIGDVTLPLAPAVIEALHKATEEQARKETFHGYSPDSDGYPFLREAIAGYSSSTGRTPSSSPTRCTPCTWTPTCWTGGPSST